MRAYRELTTMLLAAILVAQASADAQETGASWLDAARPTSWNTAGAAIPAAPRDEQADDARCRAEARTPQLNEDRRVRAKGWDLMGEFEGGWDMLVIGGTAGYDGMCRPSQYQEFVFVHGIFAGTLAPEPMDSRTDGALSRVEVQGNSRLSAEYLRYAPSDALCCPSRTTRVLFNVTRTKPIVTPVSAQTTNPRAGSGEWAYRARGRSRSLQPIPSCVAAALPRGGSPSTR